MKWFSGNAQHLAFIPISGGCCGVITTLRPFGCPQGREDTAPPSQTLLQAVTQYVLWECEWMPDPGNRALQILTQFLEPSDFHPLKWQVDLLVSIITSPV